MGHANTASKKVADFFQDYPSKQYKKDEVLFHAHEPIQKIVYLKEGRVRQYDISDSGDKVVVNIFKPPAFFPMASVMTGSMNNYFFEAETDLVVRVAPPKEVDKFLKDNPDVLYDLLTRVYSGVDGLLRRLAHLMGGHAKSRLIFEMIIEAKRFGKKQADGSVILNISENELGIVAGLRRETVSRELSNLKRLGLVITSRHQITITKLDALEELIGDKL